jgi:hypothetical protein
MNDYLESKFKDKAVKFTNFKTSCPNFAAFLAQITLWLINLRFNMDFLSFIPRYLKISRKN